MNEEILETGEEIPEEIIEETVSDPVDDISEVTETESPDEELVTDEETVLDEEYAADQEAVAVTGSSNSTVVVYDDTLLLQEVQQTNYLLTVLVFLVLFTWVESRIRSAVWRYFGNGKPN